MKDPFDFTGNVRFGGSAFISGGLSTAHTVTDICDIVDDVPEFAVNLGATTALTANSVAGPNNAPSRFCRIAPPIRLASCALQSR